MFQKIQRFADKAMTRLATRDVHGSVAWWPVWNKELNKYEVLEHIFFAPKGESGIWLTATEYRKRSAEIRSKNRSYYEAHPLELIHKLRKKRGTSKFMRLRTFATVGA